VVWVTELEASVERVGRDWLRELLEEVTLLDELTLLSAAWLGFPLFPQAEHERKEEQ
jgi:hypothetical protein